MLVTRKPRVTSSKTRLVRFECAYGTSTVVIFRYVIFRYALSYFLGTPSFHVGQVRLFLDIAGVIAIYFMSPASRTYPGTAIYFMFWTAIYSYFGL